MKKRRIRKWVKILLTIITIISSVMIYILTAKFSTKATDGILYTTPIVLAWIWLFFGQFTAYYFIWEN